MEWFGEVWRRLLFLLRRRQFDRDIEEEMRLHRELAGARRFGNELLLREESRDSWGWRWLETLLADIRFALRLLRRNPAFTVVAILTLGLAIGANTLVFSLVNTVLLRPLPYADPESLYTLWTVEIQSQTGMNTSFPDFRDWQEQSHMFPAMSAFGQRSFNLTGAGNPERIDALEFTAGLPEVLGVGPVLGRPFRADDGKRVALLGHGLWMRHFAGDPAVLGRSIQLDGEPYTVVGVCPPSFHFPPKRFRGDPEVFVPLTPNMDRTAWGLKVVARLAPGATAAQAQSEMNAIGSRLVAAYRTRAARRPSC